LRHLRLPSAMTTPKKKPTPPGRPNIIPMTDALKQPAPWDKGGPKGTGNQVKGQTSGKAGPTPRKGLSGA